MSDKDKKVLITGNEVIAEAAIRAGCRFYAGYPITPQNELTAYMSRHMPEAGGVFIQAESELAAISMVFGAACVGERALTSSSSPGISLKQEGISYLAGCRLPAVIVNMSRGGPGLGNIAPGQADYFQSTRGGGHGDYRTIVLAPNCGQEFFDLTRLAFDLADEYRMPVLILGDGVLGQMAEPVKLKPGIKYEPAHQKKEWALTGNKTGKPKIIRSLYLGQGVLEKHNLELKKLYDKIEQEDVRSESFYVDDSEVVLVAFGISSRICKKVMQEARKEGVKVGMIRPITLWPYPYEIISRAAAKKVKFLVVEMNMGQMIEDVKLVVGGKAEVHFYGRTGGEMPQEKDIMEKIKQVIK